MPNAHKPSFRRKPESTFFFEAGISDSDPIGSREDAKTRRIRTKHADGREQGSTVGRANPAPSRLRVFARTLIRSCRWRGTIGLALTLAAPAQAAEPTTYQRALAAGYKAAFLCSGIFNAGRTQAQVEALELTGIYSDYQALLPELKAAVPEDSWWVEVAFDPSLPPRVSAWNNRTGCTLLPIGSVFPPAGSAFVPLKFVAPKAAADPRPWPTGDGVATARPNSILAALMGRSLDGESYGRGSRTVGIVVVRDGRIIAERYGNGFGPLVSNRTWSVAKSISGTLIGVAVGQGLLDPAKPALIPEWQNSNDPRAAISLDDLLRMASGLHSDTAGNRTDALYMGATTVTQEATHWPLEARPGTRFRYANNDTLLAVRSLRAALNADNKYHAFPRAELFDKIGMHHTVAETDWQGNFILSSQVWSTARDLARLGLLWLNDGVWNGERILPEGWVKYMTTPSGPQPESGPGYGATLWLFGPKQGLPEGSYAAQGNRGQYVMVIPSKRLVIVRRGEDPAGSSFDIARFSADVIKAVE